LLDDVGELVDEDVLVRAPVADDHMVPRGVGAGTDLGAEARASPSVWTRTREKSAPRRASISFLSGAARGWPGLRRTSSTAER
jgi:hypothetical protein